MKLSKQSIQVGAGANSTNAALWLPSLQIAIDKFEINTVNRIATFLANVGVESNGFTALEENLNYSAQGLANTWPNRYAIGGVAAKGPNPLALQLQHDPFRIANNVYANRLGNGDEASGDGWKCRGQGPIQLTGRTNITACGLAIGIDLISDPSQLQKPSAGSISAAWFVTSRGCNELADDGDIDGYITKVNGQSPRASNQGPLRIQRYNDVMDVIQADNA